MKKIISVALAVLMLLPVLNLSVSAAVCTCDEIPIIYVKGRSSIYEDKSDPNSIDLPYVEDGYIEAKVKEILPVFAKAYLSDNYDEYCRVLTAAFSEVYSNFSPDENGNMPGNSGVRWSWSESSLRDVHRGAVYEGGAECHEYIYRYMFEYDCRRAPVDIADDLNEYIEAVKRVTGHDKVNIVSRCLGTCVATAYVAEYGWEDIETFVMYNPTVNGTFVTNSLFSENISLDADALDYFANQQLGDETLMKFIKSTVSLANKTYGLNITSAVLNTVVEKVARLAAPDIMKVSYGTMGGYWAMVADEYYAAAREFVFSGEEEKYAVLLAKFDEYNENVGSKLEEIYTAMAADGVNMKIVAKYGYQLYPLNENAYEQSDMIITLAEQTFGATCAPFGEKLSAEYIEKAQSEGRGAYISADKCVDASTALFPDTTWIIKDMKHNCFPHNTDVLLMKLFENHGSMTVADNPDYPQYLVYSGEENNGDTLLPMTEENTGSETEHPSIFRLIIDFFKNLFALIKSFFADKGLIPANA